MIIVPPALVVPAQDVAFTSRVGSTASATATIATPEGAAAGDLAVIFDVLWGDTLVGSSFGVPGGWTQIFQNHNSANSSGLSVLAKKLTSDDLTSVATGTVHTYAQRKQMHVFRTDNDFSGFSTGTWSVGMTSGSQGARTASVEGFSGPLVSFGFAATRGAAFSWEGSPSPSFAESIGYDPGSEYLLTGYKFQNTSPVDQTADISDPGSGNILAVGFIALTP